MENDITAAEIFGVVGMENDIAAAEFSGMVGMEDTAATPVCHGSACPVVCHSEEPGGSKVIIPLTNTTALEILCW
ncbi:hypothetical protein ZEAMMB73_Zm00001d008580 [Zea mays]|jgi:hypothetical protein|uniref:Uncharacterized protein n=1 Tax=Zea mays TaxID=4577 RepID=A0A1D6FE01_MAIZE|nr:hypothetical protein ZEAMMB73_Zm00001d008580 [Zea mays]